MTQQDFNQRDILATITRLKQGTSYDYEDGTAHDMDWLMEEAAEVIEWLYNRHDFNKANGKDNRAYF